LLTDFFSGDCKSLFALDGECQVLSSQSAAPAVDCARQLSAALKVGIYVMHFVLHGVVYTAALALPVLAARPAVRSIETRPSDRRRHPIAPPVSAHTVFGPRLRVQSTTVRQGCQISSDEIREIFVHQFIHARSTQPCIPPGSLNRVPASAGVRAGMSPPPDGR